MVKERIPRKWEWIHDELPKQPAKKVYIGNDLNEPSEKT